MATPTIFSSIGYLGLNKAQSDAALAPEWATDAENVVFDWSGRLAARKGWVNQTAVPIPSTPNVDALHEYVKSDTTTSLICAAGNGLYESSDNGASWTSRTGAVVPTSDNWQFQNFNDKVIAAQADHSLLVKTSGNFAAVVASSGSVPDHPVAVLAAFGRIWCIEADLQTVKYCALLDETKWATADGGGSIDLRKVWTQGTDTALAVRAFGGRLVVFGKRHIILWVDGRGNALGLSPNDIYVEDVVEGTGTEARDSIQNIGEGDLVYLSQYGIQSLTRVLQEQQTPISDITRNSRQYFSTRIQNTAVDKTIIRSVYSASEGFYLLHVPDIPGTICVDIRQPLEDGSYRLFEWPSFAPYSAISRRNNDVLFGFAGGVVGKYSGYQDNGAPYWYVLHSGYLDLGPEENCKEKELKRIKVMAYGSGGTTVYVKWGWDFDRERWEESISYTADSGSEYAEAEYAIGEYGGAAGHRKDSVPAGGSGQYFQIGVEVLIQGSPFGLQILQAYYETGNKLA